MSSDLEFLSHDEIEAHAPALRADQLFLSIVVPTRNEADNIEPLLGRLRASLPARTFEVIFVDDSDDGTDLIIRKLGAQVVDAQIALVHRDGAERVGGLGGAVAEGLRVARAPWVCVMDADLQHPPEAVANLVARAKEDDVDIVVGSRFCADQATGLEVFGPVRTALSKVSAAAASLLFPRHLRKVTDPMSGFFMVRRKAVDVGALRPQGFKILLEILVRHPKLRPTEVPFEFAERLNGQTKASPREALRYLRQVLNLRFSGGPARFGRFGLVGISGLAVNTLVLALFSDVAGVWYLASAVLATQVSTLWNFALTEKWVFRGGTPRLGLAGRLTAFFAMNNVALLLRVPLLWVLVSGIGANHLVANVFSLLVLSVLRFGLSDSWIWSPRTEERLFNYDIHGIVTIASEGRLPELARFRVDAPIADPTITVRLGRLAERGVAAQELDGLTQLHYVEKFGNLGFGARFELGERSDITATPVLRWSPHVLYTNIVEPVLRWTFVQKGYALVHAACLSEGENAFLITARTDTGKTTTALKTLDQLPFSFLSDDLTLVTPDGRALTYPKPLTISRHTVSAVNTPQLTRTERLKLIVQSRLHSKSGRLFGLIIAKTGLPAATMNAYVQALVPPPKFQVDYLVPHAPVIPEANLRGMAIIQRDGDEGYEVLEHEEALTILLENCEDAYGFPPYPVIKHWLHSRNGLDLATKEREIITQALSGASTQLLRSPDRNWHRMFPEMVRRSVDASDSTQVREIAA